MNKEVVIFGGGVLGGMASNGASALLPQSDSPLMNVAIAGISLFGATKVNGVTNKANLLRGALLGSALVQTFIAVKKVSGTHLSAKLQGTGKASLFAKGAVGLGCPHDEGLNGQFMGGDGQIYEFDEQGLNGQYMDEAGNVFEIAENGLNGQFTDADGNVYEVEDDGLNGSASDVYGEEEEDGLHGTYEELYQ